jgi:hypothetical protein
MPGPETGEGVVLPFAVNLPKGLEDDDRPADFLSRQQE